MVTAREVIGTLQRRGVTLESDGAGGLRVKGISRLSEQERTALKAHKPDMLRILASTTATIGSEPVAPAQAATTPFPTRTEFPEPEPKDRLCYQCQHFSRSPYGFPLGLCAEHGMPEGSLSDVRGNRIQHATSRPAQFGCTSFELRAPDNRACTACRNYSRVSTMCGVVNLGCPFPQIMPCRGEHFEPGEVWS